MGLLQHTALQEIAIIPAIWLNQTSSSQRIYAHQLLASLLAHKQVLDRAFSCT